MQSKKSQLDNHLNDKNAHPNLFDIKVDKINGMGFNSRKLYNSFKRKLENFKLNPDKFQGQFTSLKGFIIDPSRGVAEENSEGLTAFVMYRWQFSAIHLEFYKLDLDY